MLFNSAIALSLTLSCITNASVQQSMQVDANAEQVKQIQDTKVSTRYGHWLFNGGFTEQAFSAVNPLYKIIRLLIKDLKSMTPFEIEISGLDGIKIIKVKKNSH